MHMLSGLLMVLQRRAQDLLRLLKDGLIGAVSITLKVRKLSDGGQNKLLLLLLLFFARRSGGGERAKQKLSQPEL